MSGHNAGIRMAVTVVFGLGIIAILLTRGSCAQPDRDRALDDLYTLRATTNTYIQRTGVVPQSIDDLLRPTDVASPVLSSVPLDPWGAPYHFERLGDLSYRLLSVGPDGGYATPDDIILVVDLDRQ